MILKKRIRLWIILLLPLLLFAITAAQAADVKQTRLPDYDDDNNNDKNFEGAVSDGQWRSHTITNSRVNTSSTSNARGQAKDDRRSSSTILRFSGQQEEEEDDNSSRAAVGKSLRMIPQSTATTNTVDNLKSFVPILQQTNLTAIQEQQQQNPQESDFLPEQEISSFEEHRKQQKQVQNVSLMIGGLAIAVGSSVMAFLLGTTTTTITTSFPQFKIMSPSLAILPWMWSFRKRPATGGFLLELMAVAEVVAQQPAWYYTQAKIALSMGFNVLLQFIIWEFWRQVWRVSGRLFLNQLFHRRHSNFHNEDGNHTDENYWTNYLPLWMQRSIDYGDATLRRGAKKWLQKSVEKTVEANAVPWFVWLGEVITLSLW